CKQWMADRACYSRVTFLTADDVNDVEEPPVVRLKTGWEDSSKLSDSGSDDGAELTLTWQEPDPVNDVLAEMPGLRVAGRDMPVRMAEVFAGCGALSKEMSRRGFVTKAVDFLLGGPEHDMSNDGVCQTLGDEFLKYTYVHFAPPCNTFSAARYPKLRTKQYPLGLPEHQDDPQLRLANKIIENMSKMAKRLADNYVIVSIENPRSSVLWHHPKIVALQAQARAHGFWDTVDLDYCQFGMEYKKATRLLTVQHNRFPEEEGPSFLSCLAKNVCKTISKMGKRASGGGGNVSARSAKKAKSEDGIGELVDKERDTIAHLPWWDDVMKSLDEMMVSHDGLPNFFMARFPDLDSRKEFAQELSQAFPLPDGECLSNDFTPGIKTWAIWQGCFHIQGGNKGVVISEYMKNLVMLILTQGCKTDATRTPGVEFPVLQPLVPAYFEVEWKTASIVPKTYECQGLAFTKGWTRSLGFLTAAYLILKHELVEFYQKSLPNQYRSFCVLKGLVPENARSELDCITANRDLTMASVQTRSKPNAFNALHQLQRRLKHGETVEQVIGHMETGKSLKSIFGLSGAEGAAVFNLVHHLPTACKNIYERGVAEFGIVKGPITHAGLGCHAMRVNFAPDLIASDWSANMKNTQSSLLLVAERIVGDFKALPPGLRKSAGAPEVQRLTRIARAWEICLNKFSGLVPHKTMVEELPILKDMFAKRVFDDWLHNLTEECPAEINLGSVPEFHKVLCKHQSSIEKEAVERAKSLQLQVQTATFQKMEDDLERDTKALKEWSAQELQRKQSWNSIVLTHKRRRYVKGLAAVRDFASTSLRVKTVEVPALEMEIASFRSSADTVHSVPLEKRLLLMVLDFTAPPSLSEIDALVQAGCNVLHQDIRNAMLVLFPQKYSGQSSKANLAAARRIEDMLLKCNANIDCDIALHYTVEGMHANDRRQLGARARLVYSDSLAGDSPWMNGLGARGKVSEIPLIRIKEMKRLCQPGAVGDIVESWNLSPAERVQQKGPKAVLKIVQVLLDGMTGLGPDHRLDLVELQLGGVPDWVEGSWQMKSTWASQPDKPQVAYGGFCRDMAIYKSIQGHLEATLMQEWWELQHVAGPPEPTDSAPVDKPVLSLASWDGESPSLSDIVLSKFDNDETYSSKWNAKVSEFREFVASTVAPLLEASVSSDTGGATPKGGSGGPDMSVAPYVPCTPEVTLPAIPISEMRLPDVLFTVKAVPKLPALHIMKDYTVFMSLDMDGVHKNTSTLSIGPCELLGFNIGDIQSSDATVDLENVIQWKCSSDVEKVAVQLDDPSSTRELMTIAEVRFKAFQKNLPDLGPKLDGNVIYTPQALSDSQLAGGVLKRAAAGAAFLV
ncbi:Uncharacterized protein SCF082_LOCUS48825, partial [Durusdinium trenchii]